MPRSETLSEPSSRSAVRRDSPTTSTAWLAGDCRASNLPVFFSGELTFAGANNKYPCSVTTRSWIPSSGATKPASWVASTCFINGSNAANTSSVSKPPLATPASRNFRNGAGSLTVRLHFGQQFSGLFLHSPHVAHFQLELARGEFFELGVQFQLPAQIQRGDQRHFIKLRVGLGEIEQHVTEILPQANVAEGHPILNKLVLAIERFEIMEIKFGVAEGGRRLKPFGPQQASEQPAGRRGHPLLSHQVEVLQRVGPFDH